MKRFVALAIILVLAIAGCSAPATNSHAAPAENQTTASPEPATAAPEPATVAPTEEPTPEPAIETATPPAVQDGKGKVGPHDVEIVSAALDTTYDKKDAVVITYKWTNNGDDAAAFMIALGAKVYQDGIECQLAILGPKSKVDTNAQLSKIKPGTTQELQVAYSIDKTKPLSVEVEENFAFTDTGKVVKEFAALK